MTLLAPTVTRVQVSPEVLNVLDQHCQDYKQSTPPWVSTTTTPPLIPDATSSSSLNATNSTSLNPKQTVNEIQPPVHPFNSQRVITTASATSPFLTTPLSTSALQQSQSPVVTKYPTTPTAPIKQPPGINLGHG
ncbi:hypothetical protein HDU76_008960, partial [Blyttiomyces sp. JEL0837]